MLSVYVAASVSIITNTAVGTLCDSWRDRREAGCVERNFLYPQQKLSPVHRVWFFFFICRLSVNYTTKQ